MTIGPWIKNLPQKQRTRLARSLVLGLSVVAVLWGLKVYYLPSLRLKQADHAVIGLADKHQLRDGDIIFQTSRSAQSQAIQLATGSKYSHCGLIFQADNGKQEWVVLEAVQPVKWTPLSSWIARGEGGHYVVKRPRTDPPLSGQMLQAVKAAGEQFVGKDYDLYFGWGDERMYCSELIWKAYHTATGLEIGKLQKLRDFDLSDPVVSKKLKERYGDKLPLDEEVISPASIFESPLLSTIAEE
ncbi:MAG: YiiX family permuted papain-like enzyme [Flavobacteriales bacterium]|nr:YiiX family permuted papain-like enzyme [Flavobacteriales bacterium]